jgi:hypothetical protein
MKKLFTCILLIALTGCNAQDKDYIKKHTAKVYDMQTHIPVPGYHRKEFGYDSIQLLVEDGKITANFCYPNHWLYAKDTVYTEDTTYRLWGFSFKITPDIFITTRDAKRLTTLRNGYFDMTKADWHCDSVIIDSFKIKVEKVPH